MIRINKIASSSSGNAVVIEDSGSKLLLDCGLPYSKLSKKVQLSEIDAVLLTHSHLDHAKAAKELLRRGTDVCMSRGTADALEVDRNSNARIVSHLNQFEIENWKILPFDVIHDSVDPLGFLLQSKNTGEKLVYIVDSAVVNYDFKGVNYWLIEANFSDELLENSDYKSFLKRRIKRNHFSIENLVRFLTTSDLSQTREIHLLHLSEANSDEKQFVKDIQKRTGVPCYV